MGAVAFAKSVADEAEGGFGRDKLRLAFIASDGAFDFPSSTKNINEPHSCPQRSVGYFEDSLEGWMTSIPVNC